VQLQAEKRREMQFIHNEGNEKSIKDFVGKDTPGARKSVEDTEAVVQQGQDDMRKDENTGLTNREPEKTFLEMMLAM